MGAAQYVSQILRVHQGRGSGSKWRVMKKLILVAILAATLSELLAVQQTRREIVNAGRSPADDAKPNSDKVPDVYSIAGKFDRVLVLRFKFDTDLLAGIEKMVKQEKI